MPAIELKNISNFICRNISLKIANGELMALLGPTGAGKTTLLNVVSGLIEYEGSVLFDGAPVDELPVNRRNVGYLFQDLPRMRLIHYVAKNAGPRRLVEDALMKSGVTNYEGDHRHNIERRRTDSQCLF